MSKYLTFAILVLTINLLLTDALLSQTDYQINKNDTSDSFTGRSGTKAIIYSALIPGGGQIYNDRYIKAGIAIGLEALFLGSGIYYQIEGNKAWDKYEETGDDNFYNDYSDYHLKSQSMLWWFFSMKFLSVLDAYVDAKLFNYDSKKRQLELELSGSSISLNYRF